MNEGRLVTGGFAVMTAAATCYFVAQGMLFPTLPRYVEDELGGGGLAGVDDEGASCATKGKW